jgi:hypothetical protein
MYHMPSLRDSNIRLFCKHLDNIVKKGNWM